MGFEKLSFEDRSALIGIASMVFGESEGAKGGTGHIGLLDENGKERIVTFDTHGGTSRDSDAVLSGDRLRTKLLAIADKAGLSAGEIRQIRMRLGLGEDEGRVRFVSLLDRKIVANVITMIGGNEVWSAVKAGHYAPAFKSPEGNTFSAVASGLLKRSPISLVNSENIPGAEGLAALKAEAERLIAGFRAYVGNGAGAVREHYVKLNEQGELVDAGRRNIFRGEGSKRENDFVRTRFYNAVLLHYEGRIPAAVQAQMTNFTQGGHPLSTSRIRLILQAMADNAPLVNNIVNENNVVNGSSVVNGKSVLRSDKAAKSSGDVDAPVSSRQQKMRLCRLANRLADKICQLLKDGRQEQKDALTDWLGMANPTRSQIRQKLREALVKENMPSLAFLEKRFVPKDLKEVQDAVSARVRSWNEEELSKGRNATGFYHDLLRAMTNSSMLKMRTVDGKAVPPGTSPVKGFGVEDVNGIRPHATHIVKYEQKAAEASDSRPVSTDTFGFFHLLEEKVPDKTMRHFLTLTMGLPSSMYDLAMDPGQNHRLGYTEESLGVAFSHSELSCNQLIDGAHRKVDISFRDGGRTAVITERVNVSPVISNIASCALKDEEISLLDNWYEVTTTVDLTQSMTGRLTPVFTQTVRHLGEPPAYEWTSEDIAPDLFASEKAALEVFDEFVAFADSQGGSGSAYVKVFEGADFDRGRVRLGATQGEEKYSGRGPAEEEVNNRSRKMFYASVERLFGGRVPEDVRREMTNDAYDGRPLSASRIARVRKAVVAAYLKKPTGELVADPVSIRLLSTYGCSQMTGDPALKKTLVNLRVPENEYTGTPAFQDFTSQKNQDLMRRNADGVMERELSSNVPQMLMEFVSDKPVEDNTWGRDVGRSECFCMGKNCSYRKPLQEAGRPEPTDKERCEQVQNSLAAAWTGVEGTTFDGLGEGDQRVVRFMQAHLNQSFDGCGSNGAGSLVGPGVGAKTKFVESVEKTEAGGLRFISRSYTTKFQKANVGGAELRRLDSEASFVAKEVIAEYSPEDVEKICKADWSKLNDLKAYVTNKMQVEGMSEYDAYQAAFKEGFSAFGLKPKVATWSAFRFEPSKSGA